MPTTDHPLLLDLGEVRGLSVYQEWLTIEGNEGKTFQEFLEEIADLGIQIRVTNVVEEDNPDAVSSGGVWDKLYELGLVGGNPSANPGSSATSVLGYTLGDPLTPDEGTDLSPWIDSEEGTNNVWTLSPAPGQEWHVDNGGTAAKALTVALPDDAPFGSRVNVFFRPDGSINECADVTITAGGVVVMGGTAPSTIGGVALECVMSQFGWIVVRHYADGESEATIVTKAAKIVYSGANRASTASTIYTTNVSWTGSAETKSATLRTDIFRKLYGKAPFRGWTTSKTGSTVTHNDGATVSLSDEQTLTLYPLYSATDVAVNLGKTTDGSITVAANASAKTETVGTYTFSPTSYVTGFKGEAYNVKIYGYIASENNHTSRLQYRIDSGEWTTICERTTAGSSASSTKTASLSGTGSHSVSFRVFQDSGTARCTSTYRCYVSAMTIS